jgi:hypothetical protein
MELRRGIGFQGSQSQSRRAVDEIDKRLRSEQRGCFLVRFSAGAENLGALAGLLLVTAILAVVDLRVCEQGALDRE